MSVWLLLLAASAVVLLLYAPKGPNAVWGTATFATLIGLVVAVITGFEWWTVGKALIIGTIAGLAFEGLGMIGNRLRG